MNRKLNQQSVRHEQEIWHTDSCPTLSPNQAEQRALKEQEKWGGLRKCVTVSQ